MSLLDSHGFLEGTGKNSNWCDEPVLTRGLGLKRYASIIRFLKASYSSSAFVSSAGRSIPKPAPLEAVTPLERQRSEKDERIYNKG